MRIEAVGNGLAEAQGQFRTAVRSLEGRIGRLLDGEMGAAKRTMVDATPVGRGSRTGDHMRDEWQVRPIGVRARVLRNGSPHALFQFTGTRPHAIPGAFGYPLPFGTDPHFHPGTKPNQRLLAAMDECGIRAATDWTREGAKLAFTLVGRAP